MTSLTRDIFSDRTNKNNMIIKLSPRAMCCNVLTIKINLFQSIIDSKKEGVTTKIMVEPPRPY